MKIATKYSPAEIEQKWYEYWLENNLFHSEPDEREPYAIVIPPPNVTGVLHMGHMLNNTIQDVLVRRARMQGKNACWVPGTDHASIATEAKVVQKLTAEGISKTGLTREEFLKHAWDWTHKHGGIILEQLKKLGCSCDWERTAFTMDEIRSESVFKVFCNLYEKGLIYRGVRMVNWDPKALTALSDEEVNYKEQNGKLFYLKYKISAPTPQGGPTYAVVATTRPETIMGDTAMCINPNNPKTAWLKGKKVIVPLINREIPVIEDEYVDMEFGTGCLKVTPAHDINDYMLGEKYGLPSVDIFNNNGTLNNNGAMYAGMDRFDCRKQIERDLIEARLLEKTEPYTNKVGFSERTDVPIEPKLSMQWFLKMEDLAKPALEAVEDDTIKFYPEKFKNTHRHWMTNIKDWCISRQLWWGHQIPAWYIQAPLNPPEGGAWGFVVAPTEEKAREMAIAMHPSLGEIEGGFSLKQDEDCLDTWFSSWLWPVSVFNGINRPGNPDICYYYPTSDLVTGPDIIFFWVARMIMAGEEFRGKEPFRNVYFTGIVRDQLGRKMAKQLGNSPDPIELMNKYGADGVRMGMLFSAPAGNDLLFDESLCEQGRNFCNKIWNAFRLVKGWETADIEQPIENNIANDWFFAAIAKANREVDDLFLKYRLSEALTLLYKLFWDDFCSWYLEIIKPEYGKPIDNKTYNHVLGYFEYLLKLLHPFMPFITEELFNNIEEEFYLIDNKYVKSKTIMTSPIYSEVEWQDEEEEYRIANFETAKEIITNIRNIRASKNISPKEKLALQVSGAYNNDYTDVIRKLANVEIEQVSEKSAGSVSFMVGTAEFAVPVGNLINAEEEIDKMEKEIIRLEGFLKSVNAKLGNERFVANAKPEIVEVERKKQADAETKIASLRESIKGLK
ncbi:MAG: valine--tRNA ligase [Bacteroidales bacterium]|jgi:valyl-tRNA synthetase|nr:valine--tRNA ligase [Bacteroidales bacterium]